MILNFYKKKFIHVQWYYLIFFNRLHCLVIGIFYVSHNITNFSIFFLKIFYWVETNLRHDGNENSLDLMVILLLFFMNIICVQIPSGKFYQALSSQNLKMFTNLLWVVIWHHSNIWMGKFVKYHHWTLWGIKKGLHNMLSSLLIWIIQNMLTLHWQVNIIQWIGTWNFAY
jgi:hypothetical protein